ncbi:hypothetical protein BJ170DRAFT_682661 [Xylariales sp. AK1849]|nr:hypothetical protein BJ170DRAFT_682661 [Xylariales sp. AK1849]
MPSNSKPARSRFSSPLHLSSSPSGHNRGLTTDGQRGFMQRWLEPPIQNKASYQEAGLVKHGVVENMAPLGTLPKAVKKQPPVATTEGTPAPSVKRIVFKKSAARATPNEQATPQPPIATVESTGMEAADLVLVSPTRPGFPVGGIDDDEDEDYMPRKTTKARRSSQSTNPRPVRSGRRSTARPKSPTPHPPAHTPTAPQEEDMPLVRFKAPASVHREPENKELADRIVEEAVEEALIHHRYPTAWALRLLYDENSSDPHFVSMIEDVFHQRADIETLQEFNRLISARKREGKREDKGCYYFVPADNGNVTPQQPKAAPYSSLLTMDITPAKNKADDLDRHVNKKIKLEGSAHDITGSNSMSGTNGLNGLEGIPAHKSPHKSPSKGKKTRRSGSMSSESSLSSVPDDFLNDYDDFMDQVDGELGVSRPSTAEPNDAPTPAGSFQPISARHKKPAAKKKNASSKPVPSHNTPQPSLPLDPAMPAAITVNGASTHHKRQTPNPAKAPIKVDEIVPDDLIQLKEVARRTTVEATRGLVSESFSRPLLEPDFLGEEVPASVPTEQNRSIRTPALTLTGRAARAAKRNHDDLDESISPTTAVSFRADFEPPSSTRNSRAATPSNLCTTKKQRAGLRVKNSPMKKKGTSAGIPRGSGERPSPVGNGISHDKDDNDDSCYSCGGQGELVCCDGCNYSFHFLCIDPPMDEANVPDDWFCNDCMHKYFPAQFTGHRGTFGSLLDALDKKNPRAYRLPHDIREYFEGVRTGADGEYEETANTKPKPNKKGYEEPFDFYRLKNAEGNAVLCFQCHTGATENRAIIPCSVCGLHWHLECLDPPLTQPPAPRSWRCPCHVEDAFMAHLAPAHKYRKIKHAPLIEQAYSRGMANNGWIEIEEDDDEPEDSSPRRIDFGRVYRLPEKGIKLDFISRVRRNRARAWTQTQSRSAKPDPALSVAPSLHTIEEQQAALNLSQLARGGDGVDQLVGAMISQASPAVVSLIAQGDASRIAGGDLSEADANALQAMLAQVDSFRSGISKILVARGSKQNETTCNGAREDSAMQMD